MALIMDYHKSGDLKSVLHGQQQPKSVVTEISPAQRASWAVSAARAMAFLHSQHPKPLIHLDIDSSNFLVDGMQLKLSDFTNCVEASRCDWDDYTQLPRGNYAYMAPEIFKQEPVSPKSDVFSFGVLLWELWTRQIPWKGVSSSSIEAQVLVGDRLEIPVGEIPATIARLIKRCWVEDPSDRPDSIEILHELWNYKRLGRGKSPATPYPQTGQSSNTMTPRRGDSARLDTSLTSKQGSAATVGASTPAATVSAAALPLSPSSSSSSVAAVALPNSPVPLPMVPQTHSSSPSVPRVASPTPQRFAPSLNKYKLQLLGQMQQDSSANSSPRTASPVPATSLVTSMSSPELSRQASDPTVSTESPSAPVVVSPKPERPGALLSPVSPPMSLSADTTPSPHPAASPQPPTLDTGSSSSEPSSAASSTEIDPVDLVLGMLDTLNPSQNKFEPPTLAPRSLGQVVEGSRYSTIDDILKHAESLLDALESETSLPSS